MKKITCMLVVILLLIAVVGTVDAENDEYTYLAILNRYTEGSTIHDAIEGPIDASLYDIGRAVHAILCFSRPVPLILPDWNGWEDTDDLVGARLTFDKPFDVLPDRNGLEILQIPDGVILEPKRVEIIGEIKYGAILEIGDDYIVHDALGDNWKPSGNSTRYIITPDTLVWYEELPFEPGSGCQMIVDEDGVVLAMLQANG